MKHSRIKKTPVVDLAKDPSPQAIRYAWIFSKIHYHSVIVLTLFAICLATFSHPALAQFDFDREPIHYSESTPTDQVSLLVSKIEKGDVTPTWKAKHGWLPWILEELNVPTSSQTLVYSKTSMQFRRINPSRPRAVYFNDNVYVGWVNGGDVLELGVVDSKLGAVFYSVDQKKAERPTFRRDRGECLACHANGRTQDIPGFLVRSVYPQKDGQPDFRLGSLATNQTTPLKDRFGGWYVTGLHGDMRHRGNVFVNGEDSFDPIDRKAGANLDELPSLVRKADYLEPTSDIVALMLLEHQTQMHNYVTKAGYTCRMALAQQSQMNRILDRPADYRSESTVRRIKNASEKLVQYLLFVDEFRMTSPIKGNSRFSEEFAREGIRDAKGRSLRDLDLKTRLLRYPCSYLVYSDSFLSLPAQIRNQVTQRMRDVLTGSDQSKEFAHLSANDRRNILEILTETHPLFKASTEEVDANGRELELNR